jgi:hypothetical protein
MFSQLRNAVESLATPVPPRAGSPAPQNPQGDDTTGHAHGDPNLRKVMASQRAGSPGPSSSRLPRSASPSPSVLRNAETTKGRKMNLEERLRAKFVIGEASNSTTPDASKSTSPTPDPMSTPEAVPGRVVSPASIPLPESPLVTAAVLAEGPSDSLELSSPYDAHQHIPSPLSETDSMTVSPTPLSPAAIPPPLPEAVEEEPSADPEERIPSDKDENNTLETTHDSENPPADSTSPVPEALSPQNPSSTEDAASPDSRDQFSLSAPETLESPVPPVESLQKRLKLVEQRFAGRRSLVHSLQARKL